MTNIKIRRFLLDQKKSPLSLTTGTSELESVFRSPMCISYN